MAQQSALLKEDQLRREEEKLKEIELRVQREILQRKQELSESLRMHHECRVWKLRRYGCHR
jgi:cell division control protein 11